MNSKMIKYIISHVLELEAGFLFLPFLCSLFLGEDLIVAFSYLMTIMLILGCSYFLSKGFPENQKMYTKEGMMIVSLSWIALSFFGSLPFVISGRIPSFVDAFFEVVAGFTTTGTSVVPNIELMEKSLLFWKGLTHFIGGLGMLVLVLAILPKVNSRATYIMKAEVPGPVVGKIVAKTAYNFKILYLIYILIAVVITILLILGGMPFFDAVIHAFGVASTGGVNIKSNSVGFYNSAYVDIVLGIGMILCSINFNLFYYFFYKGNKKILKNEELRFYFGILVVSIIAISINLYPFYNSFGHLLRDVFFTVSSFASSTGYTTVNFNTWTTFSKVILMILAFVGGCSGSTAGGLKVSRIIIILKKIASELKKLGTSNRTIIIKLDGKKISDELLHKINIYLTAYAFIFIFLLITVSLESPSFLSAFTVVTAIINNIGIDMGTVSSFSDYSSFSMANKIILSFGMLAGRLEIFPVLILFSPSIYKK